MTKYKYSSFRDLKVWIKSMELVVKIYAVTESFPKAELYSLTSQIKRSSISIPSNIAEGSKRGTKKDFISFLRIAYGSAAELETQLEIAFRLKYIKEETYSELFQLVEEVEKMINGLITSQVADEL